MPLDMVEKQKVIINLRKALKHPEIMKSQSRQYYLDKIKEGMVKSYKAQPKTIEELMAEADQFAPLVWQVYEQVNISRDDVVKIAQEVTKPAPPPVALWKRLLGVKL